jgi:hypothetical protein
MKTYVSHRGNKIDIDRLHVPKIKRIIPLEEVVETGYEDMAELAVIFNHEIVEMENGTWRWKPNLFMNWIDNYAPVYAPSTLECYADGIEPYSRHNTQEGRASLSLNALVVDLHSGVFSMEEWMKYHMQTGYSLCGFSECFAQHEADEYDLPDLLERPKNWDSDEYFETVIDYMRRYHKGKVLKL